MLLITALSIAITCIVSACMLIFYLFGYGFATLVMGDVLSPKMCRSVQSHNTLEVLRYFPHLIRSDVDRFVVTQSRFLEGDSILESGFLVTTGVLNKTFYKCSEV